jgi:hypothetical protein
MLHFVTFVGSALSTVPVVFKSVCASVAAGAFRILLMPIDALKVSEATIPQKERMGN